MQSILDFFVRAEKLKATFRASWHSNSGRTESVADHSWMSCLLAMTIMEKVTVPLNHERVLKMIVLHDLAEAVTGDIPLTNQQGAFSHEDKHLAERAAMNHLLEPLDADTRKDFLELWDETEAAETPEARFVRAIDYLEGCLQYLVMDMEKWTDEDLNVAVYYRDERYQFDRFLKEFKAFVDEKTMEKLLGSEKGSLLSSELIAEYQRRSNTRSA